MSGACIHLPDADCARCRPLVASMELPPGVRRTTTPEEVDEACGVGSTFGAAVKRICFPPPPTPPPPPRVPGRITCTPGVCGGKPCLDGTRIPVMAVWSFIETGHTDAEILREYPTLTDEDVKVSRALLKMARRHWKEKAKAAMREAFAVVEYPEER